MKRLSAAAAFSMISLVSAASLAASPPQDDDAARDAGRSHQQVFISPAGEAFRAPFGLPYPVAAWFAQADTNHDGKLDKTEFENDFARFFAELDVGHQGALSQADIDRYEKQIVPEVAARGDGGGGGGSGGGFGGGGRGRGGFGGGGRGGGHGGGGGHRGHRGGGDSSEASGDGDHAESYDLSAIGAARYSLIATPEPVTSMDIDMNGEVSRDEFAAAADRRFDELDQNGRGYLTLKDLPETPAERHHGHR
jgi:hypothetical protein